MEIAGSAFLVTGGGSGLGAACVQLLIERGARVAIADVDEPRGAALAHELGDAARFVHTDVTSAESMHDAVETAVRELGELRGLVTCAGVLGASRVVGRSGPHDLALFERVVRVNLLGTFNAIRLAAAVMTRNAANADGERGVIVTTASVAAFDGQIGQAAYAASKGGVASLTLPIARELAQFGVRIVAIAPGVFATPMVAALPPDAQASLAAQTPFPARLGQPREFALLVEQIIVNAMLNGSVIRLDGALRMGAK